MTLADARSLFTRLARATGYRWPCALQLQVGNPKDFPEVRNMAFAEDGTRKRPAFIHVTIAPKLLRQPEAVVRGVLAHELGHALAFCAGDVQHSERTADELAGAVVGVRIRYNAQDVQTAGAGRSPRPAYLPR